MTQPLRILIAALGGEGGGVLMTWIVAAARAAGHPVQSTSVPGVAQRTGATSYYVEIGHQGGPGQPVLGLVPMPGRVDALISSELMETARQMTLGFVSDRTVLVSSTARTLSMAEKVALGDGRYDSQTVIDAARAMAREALLLDLNALAEAHGTFVSATMFGALAGSGVLPWGLEVSEAVLGSGRGSEASKAGFRAAAQAVAALRGGSAGPAPSPRPAPDPVETVIDLGAARCADYLDEAYAQTYRERVARLQRAAQGGDHQTRNALEEAARRLALWMCYEDIARVADLKTRPERFARIRAEAQMTPDQVLTVRDYLKPRAEELADILPAGIGARLARHAERGGRVPFLGRGITIASNGVFGYRALRLMAAFRRLRRRSYRFQYEQAAIESWLGAMETALPRAPGFAEALAELPRVLKGYSDTLERGKRAYARITETIVAPALAAANEGERAADLRAAISAAMADDTHARLDQVLTGNPPALQPPTLR